MVAEAYTTIEQILN